MQDNTKAYTFKEYVINESVDQDESGVRLFCDMDGVLTDFDRGFKRMKLNHDHLTPDEYNDKHGHQSIWQLIDQRGIKFWKRLPWMKDGRALWDYIQRYKPIILSSPSRSKDSVIGKLDWLKLNLGINEKDPVRKSSEMKDDTRVIFSNHKEDFATGKNDVLIDDKKSNIEKWVAAGGTGILHTDATDSIRLLESIVSKNSETEDIQ